MRKRVLLLPVLLTTVACSWSAEPNTYKAPADTSSAYSTDPNDSKDPTKPAAETLVVEADTACAKIDDDGETLVDGPGAPRFTRLGMVGTRRFAASEDELVVFDSDGNHASDPFTPVGTDLLSADSDGTNVGVISIKPSGARFTKYAADGSKTSSIGLDATSWMGDPGLAVASSGSSFFVVRAHGTSLAGMEIGASAGQSVDFATGTFGSSLSVASAHDASGYAVVWAGETSGGSWRLNFMRWGKTKAARVILTSSTPLHVTKLVPTATGFGVLFGEADVAALDSNGVLVGPVHRYQGAKYAWDLAANGTAMALVAKRTSGEPMLRTLDSSGAPTADWACLDGSIGSQIGGAAIDADHGGKKWAIVHTTPKGAARFVRQ